MPGAFLLEVQRKTLSVGDTDRQRIKIFPSLSLSSYNPITARVVGKILPDFGILDHHRVL